MRQKMSLNAVIVLLLCSCLQVFILLSFQRRLDLLEHVPRYPKKITTRQLLNLLEVNGHEGLIMRKVQRDLEAIETLGMFGLEVDKRSKPYGWSINASWKKLNISLMDANSALAFSTLKEVAGALIPESTLTDLAPYFDKADVMLEGEKSPLISHWKKSVAFINNSNPVSLPKPDPKVLSQVKQAIFHQKQITADFKRYLIANEAPIWKRYQRINPLGLIQREYAITLICSIGSFDKKVYKFPMAFIRNVQIEEEAVRPPKGFDFEKIKLSYSSNKPSEKEVKLGLLARRDSFFVMSHGQLSDDQTIEDTDHAEMVKITATVKDTPKLRAFLRGLGSAVEVTEPQVLRRYFKELAQNLLNKYQD